MKTFTLYFSIALLAGSTAVFAADENQPGKTPAGQPQIVRPIPIENLPKAEALPAREAARLKAIGTKVFGIRWGKKVIAAADRGFQVVTDGTTTVSYRPAGNAYFVQTEKDGLSGKSAFRGTDKQLIMRGRTVLSRLGISSKEIAETRILQQYVSEGEMDPATGRIKASPPRKDRRSLLVSRTINGLPVFSSQLALDLDGKGNVAALELSWPRINPKVLEEAMHLQKLAASDFKAPELKGARVESIQAGILHSPAAAFVDDQVAAIRVIYASTDPKVGKKPVAYLDANGRPVEIPRLTIARPETPAGTRSAKQPAPVTQK